MKALTLLLGIFLFTISSARASVDFSAGSLFRTAGVPAWNAGSGTFTIMLWVYGPSINKFNDYFNADDGGPLAIYVKLGSADDSPTGPYFATYNGEWHFNKDGSYVANPAQSFDVTLGWTFLAVSFTQGGATDMYAWQAGVNNNALVHIVAQTNFSSISGTGSINTFMLGNQSGFDEGCLCFIGPVYVYDGVALSQQQVDAQRQQLSPLINSNLIAFSSFTDIQRVAVDESNTANWALHKSLSINTDNPPVQNLSATPTSPGSTTTVTADSGSGGGGAMNLLGLLILMSAGLLRGQRIRSRS